MCDHPAHFRCEEIFRDPTKRHLWLLPPDPQTTPVQTPVPVHEDAPSLANAITPPWYPAPGSQSPQNAKERSGQDLALVNPVPVPKKEKVPSDHSGRLSRAAVLYLGSTEGEVTAPPDVGAIEASGVECELRLPPGVQIHPVRPLVAVPARTGRTDRHEITYRALAELRWATDVFRGEGTECTLLSVVFPEPKGGDGE
jgi:hypothetical protein